MEFEWDETKEKENLRKHGIDFISAATVFDGPMLTRVDTREDYGEVRWIGIGTVEGRVVVVCFTERGKGNKIRIISARKALSHERERYEKEIANRLGIDR
ncbi:MAG: BrnT family toxin [Candidatus Omnitrophica bacterium]|nr:BrnT family toxin [Candidatus Omnitrophota bacterium]